MDPDTRHEAERRKWDAHAQAALPSLDDLPMIADNATFRDYAQGRVLLAGMADFLGDLDGREVLEYGCGLGELTIVLARNGAHVTTFDLSPASVEFTRRRAERDDKAVISRSSARHRPVVRLALGITVPLESPSQEKHMNDSSLGPTAPQAQDLWLTAYYFSR